MIVRMKQRVTVSLPADVLGEAERLAARGGVLTRSAVVERALRLMVKKLRDDEILASLDRYYLAQSTEEREEEAALLAAFRRLRGDLDIDLEGAAPATRRRR